jgi:hypothetical protein
MKFEILSEIVRDDKILGVWEPLYDAEHDKAPEQQPKVKQTALVAQLFSSTGNIENVSRAIAAFRSAWQAGCHQSTCKRMLSKIRSYAEMHGSSCDIEQRTVREFVALCTEIVEKKKAPHVEEPGTSSAQPLSYHDSYALFLSDKNWRLADFGTLVTEFSAENHDKSRALQRCIDDFVDNDPAVQAMSLFDKFFETPDNPLEEGKKPWNATYEQNRLGAHAVVGGKPVTLNWTTMLMPFHRYFVGGCPFTLEGASVLFSQMIVAKCPVIASAHQLGSETGYRVGVFWKPETLQNVPLENGWQWSLDECTSSVLQNVFADEKQVSDKAVVQKSRKEPHIIKSILVARRGEEKAEITHFHYVGWKDYHSNPSLPHFLLLLTEMMQIKVPQGAPVAANCKAGVGRSGLIVVVHHLLMEIIDQLQRGVDLDAVRLNIVERFCQLRKQRRIFLSGPTKVVDVLLLLFEVYKIIKRDGVTRFLQQKDIRLSSHR